MEHSRVRPRLDYINPAVPFPGPDPRGRNNKICCPVASGFLIV